MPLKIILDDLEVKKNKVSFAVIFVRKIPESFFKS